MFSAEFRGSDVRPQEAKKTRHAVCKIFYFGKLFDFDQPYNKNYKNVQSTGTGFVLDNFRATADAIYVVTAYHVVGNATRILVEFSQLKCEPIVASVEVYNMHLDVALVKVPMDKDKQALITSLQIGKSDDVLPTHPVLAAGFALGHDYQMTSGTVSGRTDSLVQVDCAINGGNSGGPLIDSSGKVVGVVVSGYGGDVQNVNFVAPINETVRTITSMLKRRKNDDAISFPELSFNATFVPSSEHLVSNYGCPSGAYVSQVHPEASILTLGMEHADLLCKVDGYAVDLRGKISVDWWKVDPLNVETLLERKDEGDDVAVEFWSERDNELKKGSFKIQRNLNVFRRIDPIDTPPKYSCRGGMVVQSLLRNHKHLSAMYKYLMSQPQVKEQSLLVITCLRAETPFTAMKTVSKGDIVNYVNKRPVRTIQDYVDEWRAWEESEVPHLIIQLLDGNVVVASRESIERAEVTTREETQLEELEVV